MPITHEEFLTRVIDEGIAAARRDYSRPDQKDKLEGSVAAFVACRGKSVLDLAKILAEADVATDAAANCDDEKYWFYRCFAAEVEWVCNCVSAVLHNEGKPVIIPPTARGYMQAAKIIGVKEV
jgi:hypothetical protein